MAGRTYNNLVPFLEVRQKLNDLLAYTVTMRNTNYSAAGNTFPTAASLPTATGGVVPPTTITAGDEFIVGTAGTLGGTAVVAGDILRALVAVPGQVAANWGINQVAGGGGSVSPMGAATDAAAGTAGSAPAPGAGTQDLPLHGDATYKGVAPAWITGGTYSVGALATAVSNSTGDATLFRRVTPNTASEATFTPVEEGRWTPIASITAGAAASTFVALTDTPNNLTLDVGSYSYNAGTGALVAGEVVNFAGGGSAVYAGRISGNDVAGVIRLTDITGVTTGALSAPGSGWAATFGQEISREITAGIPMAATPDGLAVAPIWPTKLEDEDAGTFFRVESSNGANDDVARLEVNSGTGVTTSTWTDSTIQIATITPDVNTPTVITERFGIGARGIIPLGLTSDVDGWSATVVVPENTAVGLEEGEFRANMAIGRADLFGGAFNLGNSAQMSASHQPVDKIISGHGGQVGAGFQFGEVVTAAPSGATGTIITATATSVLIRVTSDPQVFTAGDVITGGTSATTATLTVGPGGPSVSGNYFSNISAIADPAIGAPVVEGYQAQIQASNGVTAGSIFVTPEDGAGSSQVRLTGERITIPDTVAGVNAASAGVTSKALYTVPGVDADEADIREFDIGEASVAAVQEVAMTGGTDTITAASIGTGSQVSITSITAATTLELDATLRADLAAGTRKRVRVKDESGDVMVGREVTITDSAGGTPFEGLASLVMNVPYGGVVLSTDGINWFVD